MDNIKKMMALRLEALTKVYREGITYSYPSCENDKIKYTINGNGYVKDGEVTLELAKDGSFQKTLVKTGNLNYTIDYMTKEKRQVVNSLAWESSDPKFPGRKQVTNREIPSAIKQEIVERGMSFQVLNQSAGLAARECCTQRGKSCEGFLPPEVQQLKARPASR